MGPRGVGRPDPGRGDVYHDAAAERDGFRDYLELYHICCHSGSRDPDGSDRRRARLPDEKAAPEGKESEGGGWKENQNRA